MGKPREEQIEANKGYPQGDRGDRVLFLLQLLQSQRGVAEDGDFGGNWPPLYTRAAARLPGRRARARGPWRSGAVRRVILECPRTTGRRAPGGSGPVWTGIVYRTVGLATYEWL